MNQQLRSKNTIAALMFLAFMLVAAWLSNALRPTEALRTLPAGWLEKAVPMQFGDWKLDPNITPMAPDPTVAAAVSKIYSELVSRTYVNAHGERVMLSIAYGKEQNDRLRAHEPAGCYGGQGFAIQSHVFGSIALDGKDFPVRRMVAVQDLRIEPITYWMVVGNDLALTGWQAKKAQLKSGLNGKLPDGLIFRVSSINKDATQAYQLQDNFVTELRSVLSPKTAEILIPVKE